MKNFQLLFSLSLFTLLSCTQTTVSETSIGNSIQIVDTSKTLTTIAFGSCNKGNESQSIWQDINSNNPDLWIWLGDNIYGDTKNPNVLKRKYDIQKANAEYKKLIEKTPVIGTWDDHDYGQNDGNKTHPIKKESQQLLLDFLDVPANAKVRTQEGVYQAYTFGKGKQKVKIILLDTRYFRDELVKNPNKSGQRYLPNETGTILGGAQWQWLEGELRNSDAAIHIIGSGIQMIPEEHNYEKWANFPNEYDRLFDLIEKIQPNQPILVSGDRHLAEISKINLRKTGQPLYDITSSGLTHSYEKILEKGEANRHRVGNKLTGQKNFGLFHIDWSTTPPKVKVEIRGLENELIFDEEILSF